MDNSLLTILFSLPLALVFILDRQGAKKYFMLGCFTMLFALPFEALAVVGGLWSYAAMPQIFSVSVFTLLAYFPWIVYAYFSGNFLSLKLRLNDKPRYALCGAFGSLYAGFLFDPVSVWLGYYTFHLQTKVFGVPWAVILTEAFCVAFVILVFEKIVLRKLPAPV